MPTKHHRPVGQLRTHSRTSSATKLGANLQLTQAAPNKPRKGNTNTINGYDQHHHQRSTQRINSAVHLEQPSKRPPTPKHQPKPKSGFTIAASPDDDNEDDWVSTESGAGTPSHDDALSDDDDSNVATPVDRALPEQLQAQLRPAREAPLPPPKPLSRPEPPKTFSRSEPAAATASPPSPQKIAGSPDPSHLRPNPKRTARPPSTHSMTKDSHLRPHPLIRGNSYGQPNPTFRPTPLAPLTILTDERNGDEKPTYLDTPLQGSPESPFTVPRLGRKTSFSSATSVATLPVQSLSKDPSYTRTRTLSAISASSSSNALSSLAHLPAVSRPPSPQTISFFPVSNPRAHVEGIHPLLHPDYLQGHLTALRYRQPLRECYDRVMWAKQRQ